MLTKQMSTNGCINLVGGIIRQAIEDLSNPDETIQADAKVYLYSENFDYCCSSIGVNVNYIREKIGLQKNPDFELPKKQCERMPWGTLKKMTEKELKKYKSNYRKAQAKRKVIHNA